MGVPGLGRAISPTLNKNLSLGLNIPLAVV